MRRYLLLFVGLLAFYGVGRFCHQQTDGFQILNIRSTLPYSANWEMPGLSAEELRVFFTRPFRYLDSGGQCYAFVSEDGKTVLKLFKMHHLRQYPWLSALPLPAGVDSWRAQLLQGQKEKLEQLFSSTLIAATTLKRETGLLAANLNPQATLESVQVRLIDKLGIQHTVDLSDIPFILQYRANNPFKILRRHLNTHDIARGKEVIEKIVACLRARYAHGIHDLDPALRRNIGLLEERAICIDVGAFCKAPSGSIDWEQQLRRDTARMRAWLDKRCPEWALYLDKLSSQN